jgi:hypothetical protein
MRFIIIRKADSETEAGAEPTEQLIDEMVAYHQRLIDAGVVVDGAGLQRSAKGARVSFKNGKPTVTDGPFTETKELVAGYTVIDVKSKDEAIAWMKQWPTIDGHGNVQLELRQLFEHEDFGEKVVEMAKSFSSTKK